LQRELIIIAGPDKGRCFGLSEGQTLVIGRGPASDTKINDRRMSRVHCRVAIDDDVVVLTDTGSSSGTWVGDQKTEQCELKPDDVFRVGETEMQYICRASSAYKLWVLGRGESRSYALTDQIVTIGRTEGNAIQIPDPSVSSRHAQVVPDGKGWRIEDLGSTNGTLVQGERIDQSPLTPGLRVRIADWELFLDESIVVDDSLSAEDASPAIMTTMPVIPDGLFQDAGSAETLTEVPAQQRPEPVRKPKESAAEKKLRVIQSVGEKLIRTTDMQQLADEIIAIVVEHTGADRVLLCLLDKQGLHIPIASHGFDPGQPIRVSRTLLRRLLQQKSGILIKQAASDEQRIVVGHPQSQTRRNRHPESLATREDHQDLRRCHSHL